MTGGNVEAGYAQLAGEVQRLAQAIERMAAAFEQHHGHEDYERVMTASGDAQAVALLQSGWRVISAAPVDPYTDRQKEQAGGGQLRIPTVYTLGLPRARPPVPAGPQQFRVPPARLQPTEQNQAPLPPRPGDTVGDRIEAAPGITVPRMSFGGGRGAGQGQNQGQG